MIVLVCPGQGSQTPGFLEPWLAHPQYRMLAERFSDASGVDLVAHGTRSDADTIRNTAVAQPLIVAAGLMALETLLTDERKGKILGIAGHSVGEITAAAGAGILGYQEAMALVRERATVMAAAAALEPTGMSAVVGADEGALLTRLDELGLEPANFNGGGQIVVAGALDALDALKAAPLPGSRVIPLQVAGAFHTRYMEPAKEALARAAAAVEPAAPGTTIWSNRDGSKVDRGREFLDLVVGQVSSPVRWDRCMEAFAAAGVTGIVELAPAGALVGLAKRGLKGLPAVAIKTPDDLASAIELIDSHA